jgi:hypothetical protein
MVFFGGKIKSSSIVKVRYHAHNILWSQGPNGIIYRTIKEQGWEISQRTVHIRISDLFDAHTIQVEKWLRIQKGESSAYIQIDGIFGDTLFRAENHSWNIENKSLQKLMLFCERMEFKTENPALLENEFDFDIHDSVINVITTLNSKGAKTRVNVGIPSISEVEIYAVKI